MAKEKEDIRIAILPYGWVFVGSYSVRVEFGSRVHTLTSAKNIRNWTTGKGLCAMGKEGPENVKLDDANTIQFEQYIGLHSCDADVWKKALGL